MFAAREGHLPVVQCLQEAGAPVDCMSKVSHQAQASGDFNQHPHHQDGWTALMLASLHNHLEVLRFLLQAGASVGSQSKV